MPYAYPPHLPDFSYVGKYLYSLRFRTHDDTTYFKNAENVSLAYAQILRAVTQHAFEITVYCFMPDHVHLLVEGLMDGSDCRAFIKTAKQYSGYYFKQRCATRLWQRYGYEHVLRSDFERAATIRYIIDNPVVAGLAKQPQDYPFLGSQHYTVDELLQQAAPRS
jgi:putative transposase